MGDTALLVVLALLCAGTVVGVTLYNAWRHPDVACRVCGGTGYVFACTPVLRRLASGKCWWCKAVGWKTRRLARWLKWDRNSRFSSRW